MGSCQSPESRGPRGTRDYSESQPRCQGWCVSHRRSVIDGTQWHFAEAPLQCRTCSFSLGEMSKAVVRQDRKDAKQKRQTRANENAAAAHPCSFQFQAVGRRISCHARQQLGVGPVFHHARVGSGINSPGVSFRHPVRRVAMLHKNENGP